MLLIIIPVTGYKPHEMNHLIYNAYHGTTSNLVTSMESSKDSTEISA